MKNEKQDKTPTTKPEIYSVLGVADYEVLNSFCAIDKYRDWMTKPFKIGDKVYSTDAYFLAIMDLEKFPNIDFEEFPPSKLKGILPEGRNSDLKINVAEIQSIFKKAPHQDCYDTEGVDIDCKECDGEGEVEWEYDSYTRDMDCPVCEGGGRTSLSKEIKNGKTRIEDHLFITIGNSRFYANKFQKLINSAIKLESTEITLTYQHDSAHGSLFKIGDLEVILMPCRVNDSDNVIASYT
jgi:hypothetical protein